ncbi:hypothetical protein D4R86_02130 [bacterium]|nr:MAG: hypothetical protein D4R86_02130 [bacterium]
MKNKKLLIIGILVVGIFLIGGLWIWNNLPEILPNEHINGTIDGIFFRYPTDPTALVIGFRSCDGSEYYEGFSVPDFSFLNKDGSLVDGTFTLINPTIGCEYIKFHGYEPGTTRSVCNVIKDVKKVIQIDKCECEKYSGEKKSLCYYYFSKDKLNEGICSEAGEKSGDCYLELAKLRKDENLCEKTRYIENCYFQLAQLKMDESICEKINTQKVKDNCYLQMALLKNDKSLCEKIIDEQYFKDKCYSQLQK